MRCLLRRCESCKEYTLRTDYCRHCDGKVRIPHPAKYSPNDRYAKYRIAPKKKLERHENINLRKTVNQN